MGINGREGSSLVWRLTYSHDHLEDIKAHYDMMMQPLEKRGRYEGFYRKIEEFDELPRPIQFYAVSDAVQYTDYPCNDIHWPIMSKRMLEVLLRVKEFPHRAYPIEVVDIGLGPIGDTDFVAVQLTTRQDYFDWEGSTYDRRTRDGNGAIGLTAFALNLPEEGAPPLFRLSAAPAYLFISDEARQALREAEIRGTRYLPLDSFISQVDLPVVIPTRSSQST